MRASHTSLWEQAVRHPFVLDLGNGSLPRSAFHAYMAQDYLFVDKFARLVASTIAKAPPNVDLRPLGIFLNTLLGAEDDLFMDVFAEMGSPWPMPEPPTTLAATARINQFLDATAKRPFVFMATTLYVTEGLYADWAQRLTAEGRRPGDRLYRRWIEIHADAALANFVAYIDRCIDATGGAPGLDATFLRILRLENGFWNAVYPASSPTPGGGPR